MTYPEYAEYKESGVDWIGLVPSHWIVPKLKYLAIIKNGRDYKEVESENGEYPVIGSGGEFSRASDYLYCGESVLLGRKGTVDTPIYIDGCFWSVDTMFYTELFRRTHGRFLYYYAKTFPFGRYSTNTALPSMAQEDLANLYLGVPKYSEQKEIANFLDHETARIDALIDEQSRLIKLLQEKRQAVIFHAVTKGLDPDVPMKDSGVEWWGQVPAHWTKTRLKYVSPFMTVGIVVNPSSYVADEGLPYIYGGEIKQGFVNVSKARKISFLDSSKNWKTSLEEGDLVTVRVGAPGLTAVVPKECEGGNCASVMLIKNGKFDSRWLCSVMNSRVIRHQTEMVEYGAAQKQFNISDAIEFWLYEPPLNEQAQIADFVEMESERFDILMSEADEMVALLKERRSALISAAVTGKVDVRNWQPQGEVEQPEYAMAAEESAAYGASP